MASSLMVGFATITALVVFEHAGEGQFQKKSLRAPKERQHSISIHGTFAVLVLFLQSEEP